MQTRGKQCLLWMATLKHVNTVILKFVSFFFQVNFFKTCYLVVIVRKMWSCIEDAVSNVMLKLHLEQEYEQAGWNFVVSLLCEFHHWFDWQIHMLFAWRSKSLWSILSSKACELACNQIKFHKQHRHSEMQDGHVIYNRSSPWWWLSYPTFSI